jgi:hypothetical protein
MFPIQHVSESNSPERNKKPRPMGQGFTSLRLRGDWGYLPFFAFGFAALLVVFFETGFLAAAMIVLLSSREKSSQPKHTRN